MAKSSKSSAGAFPAFEMPSFENLSKMMEQFKLPGVDVSALIDWQRKDFEALAEANREAYEGYMALLERRNEILRESLAQWQDAVSGAADPAAMSKQTEAAREGVQKAIENFRELSELEAETRSRAWKVVQDRMQENMSNLQKLLQPKK